VTCASSKSFYRCALDGRSIMLKLGGWHTREGAKIWSAQKLRHPNIRLHERDGPLRVVLLGDYEELARLLEEAVRALELNQDGAAATLDSEPRSSTA
jgi:hypothetical protein